MEATLTKYDRNQIREMRWRERKVWGPDVKKHRQGLTLDERMAYSKNDSERTLEEKATYQQLYSRAYKKWKKDPVAQAKDKARLEDIFRHNFRREMQEIFDGKSEDYKEINTIKITKEAFDKANQIAQRVVNVFKSPNEVYLHMLNGRDKEDNVVREVYIPHQNVTPSLCKTDTPYEYKDRENISKQNYKIIGWAHSHGNFNPFHSGTDYDNLKHIQFTHGIKKSINLKTFSSTNPYKVNIWYIPSLVFNAHNAKPAKAISIEYCDFRSDEVKHHINENPILEIIEEANNINTDQETIDSDIWERVRHLSGFKRDFEKAMTKDAEEENEKYRKDLEEITSIEYGTDKIGLKTPINQEEDDEYKLTKREYLTIIKEIARQKAKISNLEEKIEKYESNPFLKSLFIRKKRK